MSQEFNLEELVQPNPTQNTNVIANDDSVFKLAESEFNLPLRIKNFPSSKEYEQFVKSVERAVRSSQEYKLWVSYIIEHMGHSYCALTKEHIGECPIEIHHHPITLYTVVKGVVNKYLSSETEFSTFDIATKVIELHFQNKVGYVVLLSSLHSKYHNGFLNIPIELVNGSYKHILQNYNIDEEEYEKICKLCSVKAEDIKQIWNKDYYPGIQECVSAKQIETPTINQKLIK